MQAKEIWGEKINATFGPVIGSAIRIHGTKDYSRIGIFAVEVISFNICKSRTERRYMIEAYQYDTDGYPVEIFYQSCKTKAELKKMFKTVVIV